MDEQGGVGLKKKERRRKERKKKPGRRTGKKTSWWWSESEEERKKKKKKRERERRQLVRNGNGSGSSRVFSYPDPTRGSILKTQHDPFIKWVFFLTPNPTHWVPASLASHATIWA